MTGCWRCGHENPLGSASCSRCGAPLDAPEAPPPDADVLADRAGPDGPVDERAPRRRRLVVLGVVLAVGFGAGIAVALAVRSDDSEPSSVGTDDASDARDEMTPAEVVAASGDAVWRVDVDGCGDAASGTAWVVGPRHLVTNAHVVSIDPSPLLTSRDGDTLDGRVVGLSIDPDIAVIEVDEDLGPVLDWAETDALRVGDDLLGLGYPAPAGDFTATPGTIISFQAGASEREAIRSDAPFDLGDSGGPALTVRGQVAGVITEIDLNVEGLRLVSLVYTADALRSVVDGFLAAPTEVAADCEAFAEDVPDFMADVPDELRADTQVCYDDLGAMAIGDNPSCDSLFDRCDRGDMAACDALYFASNVDSDYEAFGASCGGRAPGTEELCTDLDPDTSVPGDDVDGFSTSGMDVSARDCFSDLGATSPGDNEGCDALHSACGGGDMAACNDLYGSANAGSAYEEFGATCGGRVELADIAGRGSCEQLAP